MARLRLIDAHRPPNGLPPRRGIILLFVLALLALFSLVTVTFVLVARQSKQSALSTATVERTGNRGQVGSQLDFALMQALRGANSKTSVMGPHSLLEDMYGNDAVLGTVVNGFDDQPAANGTPLASPGQAPFYPTINGNTQTQIAKFYLRIDANVSAPLYTYDGAYNGRTVTMLTGAAAGLSSRVLGSFATNITNPTLPSASPSYGPTHSLEVATFGADLKVGDRVLINGGAFNGTGFGFGFPQPSGSALPPPTLYLGALDPDSTTPLPLQYALLPNPVFFKPNNTFQPAYSDIAGPGGADEPYDAVDFQNMLLALHIPDALIDATSGTDVPVPLPSLHRPELIYYWLVKSGAIDPTMKPMASVTRTDLESLDSMSAGLVRKIMLRPWGGSTNSDHPNFTGSNPSFNPCSLGSLTDVGRWDVDNDQDGICDSIWVDLGAQVQTAADGRKYKPLFALLVIDEDSRLNANTAGTLAQINATTANASYPYDVRKSADATRNGPYAGYTTTGIVPNAMTGVPYLPIGQGYGAAEINLGYVFDVNLGASIASWSTPSNYAAMCDEYGRLLFGGPQMPSLSGYLEGRYGEAYEWTANSVRPAPGFTAAPTSGTQPGDWLDDFVRNCDMPYDFFDVQGIGTQLYTTPRFGSWGSPPDLNGSGALGLDLRGQPWYGDVFGVHGTAYSAGFGEWSSSSKNDKVNDPYETSLSWLNRNRNYAVSTTQNSTVDRPFAPADLERLRRFNDIDASSLSGRLTSLAPNTFVYGSGGNNPLDAAYRRALITTETWDSPVPNALLPNDLITGLLQSTPSGYTPELTTMAGLLDDPSTTSINEGYLLSNPVANTSFTELVRRRLAHAGFDLVNHQQKALSQLVSWDLARGERLDLNRIFGDGIDSNNDGAVDNPDMINKLTELANETIWSATNTPWSTAGNTAMGAPAIDHNNDGVIGLDTMSASPSNADKSDAYARQLMARHLYVLAWSVIDQSQDYSVTPARDAIVPLIDGPTPTADTYAEKVKARIPLARRLAQWAVNMVDFRDRDSIMTGFEYDVDPFTDADGDGYPWDVDDNLATDPSTGDRAIDPSYRGVVWGCERPELLITETFAVHDRRTEDTDQEASGKKYAVTPGPSDDDDYDQQHRPVGTFLLELYAPWNMTEMPAAELYDAPTAGGIWQLNLARRTPGATPSPIWRLAVAVPSPDGTFPLDSSPELKQYSAPADASKFPTIQRVVYFTDGTGLAAITDCVKYYYRATANSLPMPLNGYAVIGPDDKGITPPSTLIKPHSGGGNIVIDYTYPLSPPSPAPAVPVTTQFSIAGTTSAIPPYTKTALTPPYPTIGAQIKAPLGVNIGMPNRLSISEPYYGDNAKYKAFDDAAADINAKASPVDDIPWDFGNPDVPAKNGSTPSGPNTELGTNAHRTVYLQRLADPTQPWNALSNPYISVDRMPVDLTVYNSYDPAIPVENEVAMRAGAPYGFGSRQRGTLLMHPLTNQPVVDIWANQFVGKAPPAAADPLTTAFQRATLGFLNDVMELNNVTGAVISNSPRPWRRLRDPAATTPAADANYEVNGPTGYGTDYVGDPEFPFPWLTWNNRPFISKHELLLVPALGPTEMLARHVVRRPDKTLDPKNQSPYLLTGQTSSFTAVDVFKGLQFGYTSPLLMSSWLDPSPPTSQVYSLPNFHRLLEFVTVPSRFAGTEMYLSPSVFGASASGSTPSGHHFNPPFNRISAVREPGKVNINTVTDLKVWQAIINNMPDSTAATFPPSNLSWQKLLVSRRGYGLINPASQNPSPSPLVINPADPPQQSSGGLPLPTFFANPFRSYGGLQLVPIPELQTVNYWAATPLILAPPVYTAHRATTGFWQNEIDATLLRVDPTTHGNVLPALPLFAQNPASAGDVAPFADQLANPYFHYQTIQKLSNLVTTRSNVYSVWVTVGYFEVTRVPVDPTKYPDGWQLGAEMGIDTGKVERHRAYYLIDRSLPVGFQRGEDTNVEKAILLKRIIE